MECTINWCPRAAWRSPPRPAAATADDGRRTRRRRAQPGAAADGDGARRRRRLHRLRRGADPASAAGTRCAAARSWSPPSARRRIRRSSRDPPAFRRHRRGDSGGGGRARDRAVAREVLLGHHHAGQDRGDHDQLRARRSAGAGSDVVRGRRHHLAPRRASPRAPARAAPARRRCSAATAWRGFVVLHLRDDRARRGVVGRQPLEVAVEMLFDLALGLDDEAQAGASPAHRRPGRSRRRRRTRAG